MKAPIHPYPDISQQTHERYKIRRKSLKMETAFAEFPYLVKSPSEKSDESEFKNWYLRLALAITGIAVVVYLVVSNV